MDDEGEGDEGEGEEIAIGSNPQAAAEVAYHDGGLDEASIAGEKQQDPMGICTPQTLLTTLSIRLTVHPLHTSQRPDACLSATWPTRPPKRTCRSCLGGTETFPRCTSSSTGEGSSPEARMKPSHHNPHASMSSSSRSSLPPLPSGRARGPRESPTSCSRSPRTRSRPTPSWT